MIGCIFCEFVSDHKKAHVFWEDEGHIAFLSIYPNTPGVSVVIPKVHYSSYAFDLSDEVLSGLTLASRKVAKILDTALEGVGVNHVHAKLFPMHGTADISKNGWRPIKSKLNTFFPQYLGYISSHDGNMADPDELERIKTRIVQSSTLKR